MKCGLESFTSPEIEATMSTWFAINYEMLIRILQSFFNLSINTVIQIKVLVFTITR